MNNDKCSCTCHSMVNANRSFGKGLYCMKCRDIHEPDWAAVFAKAMKEQFGVFEVLPPEPKLTLRDRFALGALTGEWAAQGQENIGYFSSCAAPEALEIAARLYYRMADAMLKVRDEHGQ